jgi:hypothetical protein
MCLDNTLNGDLKSSSTTHVIDTASLNEDDPRNFSLSTPKGCSEAVRRIWDFDLTGKAGEDKHEGRVPSGSRIVQGGLSKMSIEYLIHIKQLAGKPLEYLFLELVTVLGGGLKRQATGVKAARGGKQTKMRQEEQKAKLQKWRHPDLIGVSTQAIQKSKDIQNSVSNVEHLKYKYLR